MTELNQADVARWRGKLCEAERGFGPGFGRRAAVILDLLTDSPSHSLEMVDIRELATAARLPRRFVPRAVAMLTRSGIVTAEMAPVVRLILHPDRLAHAKNAVQLTRRRPTEEERLYVLRESGYRCGHCEERFGSADLQVDHVIPVNALGVDEPGNWVCLCKPHNRSKWDTFNRTFLKWYRSERVTRPIGVRFRQGFFWPVINGRVRLDRRDSIRKGAVRRDRA